VVTGCDTCGSSVLAAIDRADDCAVDSVCEDEVVGRDQSSAVGTMCLGDRSKNSARVGEQKSLTFNGLCNGKSEGLGSVTVLVYSGEVVTSRDMGDDRYVPSKVKRLQSLTGGKLCSLAMVGIGCLTAMSLELHAMIE